MTDKMYKFTISKPHIDVISHAIDLYVDIVTKNYVNMMQKIDKVADDDKIGTPSIDKCLWLAALIKRCETCELAPEEAFDLMDENVPVDARRALYVKHMINYRHEALGSYTIEIMLPEGCMQIIEEVCNAYSRFGCRQYTQVLSYIRPTKEAIRKNPDLKYGMNYGVMHRIDEEIKKAQNCDLPMYSSYGIYNPHLSIDYRIAWEIHQVVRYTISWANVDDPPECRSQKFTKYMTVNYDTPRACTPFPLPECECLTKKEADAKN